MGFDELVQESFGLSAVRREIHQELVHAAEILAPLEEVGPEGDHDGVIGFFV